MASNRRLLMRLVAGVVTMVACTQVNASLCNQGLITGKVAQSIELCTPEIEKRLDAIDKRLAANESQRLAFAEEVVRMLQRLDKAADIAGKRQVDMARSIEKLLSDPEHFESPAGLRQIRRIADQSEEFIETAGTRPITPEVSNAVVALDMDVANKLLAGMENIQKQLTDVQATLNRDAAFETLEKVADSHPKGERGQSAALQLVVAAGGAFPGKDLSGVAFRSVQVDRIDLSGAMLQMSAFSGSRLKEAKFKNSDVTAIDFTGSDLSGADLSLALAPFARASGASFEGADLGRSSWVAADLQKANFRNADLRGTNFGLADLRGADFRGAKLQNTFFAGADLRDARFEGAEISNTDVAAAVIQTSALTPAQRKGLCSASDRRGRWQLRFIVMEQLTRPTSTQLEDILRYEQAVVFWPDATLQLFQACAAIPRESLPRGRLKDSDNLLWDEFRIDVPGALMDNSGRRKDLISLIMERIRVASGRVESTLSITQAKAQSDTEAKRLESRLAELSRQAKPIAPPKMEATDTQIVLLQRLSASSVDTIIDDRIFLAMEDGKAWPHLFLDDSMSRFANWTGATTKSWRSWVSARAKAWTEGSVIFQDQSPCIRPIGDAEYASNATSTVAALAAAPINRLAWGPRLNLRGPNPDGTEWEEDIQGVFLFDAPLVAKSDACALQVVGVRLVKQPPSKQSQGGRYLIWSVKFPVSPRAAPSSGMPGLSNLDVLGIRLGMLEREADRIVRSHMKVGWIYVRARVDGMADRPHQVLKLYVSQNKLENIAVYLAPSPKGSAVVAVRRTEATEGPVPNEAIEKLLIEKYGPHNVGVNGNWVWGKGECGSVDESSFELKDLQKTEGPALDDGEFRKAVRAVDLMNHSPEFTPEMFRRYGFEKCSTYLHVFKKPKEIETTLLDHARTPWNPTTQYPKPHF